MQDGDQMNKNNQHCAFCAEIQECNQYGNLE